MDRDFSQIIAIVECVITECRQGFGQHDAFQCEAITKGIGVNEGHRGICAEGYGSQFSAVIKSLSANGLNTAADLDTGDSGVVVAVSDKNEGRDFGNGIAVIFSDTVTEIPFSVSLPA